MTQPDTNMAYRIPAEPSIPETWWFCATCNMARGAALSLTSANPACCGKPMIQMNVKELD